MDHGIKKRLHHIRQGRGDEGQVMKPTLEEDGVCIRRAVIPPEEAESLCMEARRNAHAHSELMWRLRADPRIVAVFSQLWGTTQLITSFDGIGCRLAGGDWQLDWHVDQDGDGNECRCIQGLLALTEVSAANGGTQFARGSHLAHEDWMRLLMVRRQAWQFVDIPSDLVRNHLKTQPSLKPGDMLLWDSRVTHRVPRARIPESERIVAFICMVPLSFASATTLRRRRASYAEGKASTHWPHRFVSRRDTSQPPPWAYEDAPASVRRLIDGDFFSSLTNNNP